MTTKTIVKVIKTECDLLILVKGDDGYRLRRHEDPKSFKRMDDTGQTKAFFYAVPDAAVQGWRLCERAPWQDW